MKAPTGERIREAINWFEETSRLGSKPGIEAVSRLVKLMNNPQNQYDSIHVTGTNGKGSTAAMTSSILQAAGYRVGLFTSPHLSDFTECITVNSERINLQQVTRIIEKIRALVELMTGEGTRHPTSFEVLTATALQHFADEGVEYAVIEVGMGGRDDATNVVDAKVFILTNVSLEHTAWLGDTVEKIAEVKGGIIKRGGVLVTAVTQPQVIRLLERMSLQKNTKMILVGRDVEVEVVEADGAKQSLVVKGLRKTYNGLETCMLGEHQATNAACAIAAVEAFSKHGVVVSEEAFKEGLLKVRWPGRLEVIQREPLVVLDGAKDPEAVKALTAAVRRHFRYRRIIAVVSISSDKNISEMVSTLSEVTDQFVVTRHRVSSRSADTGTLTLEIMKRGKPFVVIEDVHEAINWALRDACKDDLVLVTGSVFFVGEARERWGSLIHQRGVDKAHSGDEGHPEQGGEHGDHGPLYGRDG